MKKLFLSITGLILFLGLNVNAQAKIIFENEFLLENTGANAWVIDSLDDATGDLILQFGNTLAETLTWDSSNTLFQLSDDFYVENTLGIGAAPATAKDLYIQSLLPAVLLSDTNPTTGNRLRFDIIGTASWYSASWSDRKKVTIDNTQVNGSSDLIDFPVLYSIGADTDLAAGAQADGDDILFTASDGITKLSHEIENYTSGTGTLTAWVKIPALSATLDTEIFMYYGNAGAANQEDPSNVWNSNYAAVYHLEEDVVDEGTSVGAHIDSTSNNNDMTQNGNVEISSQIYFGQDFDGINDYTKATGSNSYRIAGDVTLETWLYRDSSATIDDLIDSQGPAGSEAEDSNHLYELWIGTDDTLRFEWEYGAGLNEIVVASTPVVTANQNWVHIIATRDVTTNEVKFYENGTQLGTTQSYTNDPTGGTINDLDLGRQAGGGSDYLDGRLDEVRISNVERSDPWIQTGYNNGNAPGTFAGAGPEEGYSTGKGMIGSVNAIPFHLLTSDTERITIASTGEVGIGITTPASALDIEKTGEVIELGDGTATDSFINFDDGADHNFGWDDSEGAISTFDEELRFRTRQSATPPVACTAAVAGMQWMDTDNGITYSCDTSNGRNKWLSHTEMVMFGDESGTCPAGSDANSNANCNVDWGNGLGPDAATNLGFYIPNDITITGYGFSEDNDACTSGSFDVEVWGTGSNADDDNYIFEADIAAGLTGQAHNSNIANIDIAGDQYTVWGLDNNCGQGIDDWNVVIYFRYRHN